VHSAAPTNPARPGRLARPGQILLSATAEPLAHRAARELGERGEQLLWKDWGRWRFKGVPQAQQVYEVGEPGIAPLRAPQQNRAKAWRDIPVWRRPAALAAELLLVAGLVGGAWFLARPQPAIAFNERDWVVVGDLRNLTGDALLDDSLAQAFRISLEQSRYVNVLSDLKARDTLQRMRRKPDTALDRAIASEIALRDGARAVILPTVAEVGGRLRFSAEVIDPHTQTTVYAASADGSGAASTLGSIDKVTAELRGRLGEALDAIQRNSVILPNATTSSLDALKAYALGRKYSSTGDAQRAIGYYERALQLDPAFAMADVAMGGAYVHVLADFKAGLRAYARAQALRDRLPPREALELDVAIARLGPPGPDVQKLEQLLELYPDETDAHLALAQVELWDRNDAARAMVHAKAASVVQAERMGIGHYMQGIAALALGRTDAAIAQFERSRTLGYAGAGYSHAYAYASRRDWQGAARVVGAIRAAGALDQVDAADNAALFAADRGDWDEAVSQAAQAERLADASGQPIWSWTERVRKLSVDVLAARASKETLLADVRRALGGIDADAPGLDAEFASFRASLAQALGVIAARLDDATLVRECMRRAAAVPGASAYPMVQQMQLVLGAEAERIEGKPAEATRQLKALAATAEASTLVHSTLRRSAVATGDAATAAAQARWLAGHRGRAYVERPADELLTVIAVADTNVAPAQ
jgi:putative peptide modification system cyclase